MAYIPRPLKWPPIFPLQKGLVAWYPFDDRSGAVLRDRSGKKNHGTLVGPTWVAGRRGSALNFAAVSYVSVGAGVGMDLVKAFTLLATVKPSTIAAGIRTILCRLNASLVGGYAINQEAAKFVGYLYGSSDWQSGGNSVTTIVANTWYILALTYDKVTLNLYVNGLLDKTSAKTMDVNVPANPYTQVSGISATAQMFLGVIADARILSRALNAAEVKRVAESEAMLVRH